PGAAAMLALPADTAPPVGNAQACEPKASMTQTAIPFRAKHSFPSVRGARAVRFMVSSSLEVLDQLDPEAAAGIGRGQRDGIAQLVGVVGPDEEIVVVRPGDAGADGAERAAVVDGQPGRLVDGDGPGVDETDQVNLSRHLAREAAHQEPRL